MLETRAPAGLAGGFCVGHVWAIVGVSLGLCGFSPVLAGSLFLPSCGWAAGEAEARHPCHPFLASVVPTLNPLGKGVGKRDRGKPSLQSRLGSVVMAVLFRSRCLLELTAFPKLLGFGERSA